MTEMFFLKQSCLPHGWLLVIDSDIIMVLTTYTGWATKTWHFIIFSPYLRQLMTVFQNSSIIAFRGQFAIM